MLCEPPRFGGDRENEPTLIEITKTTFIFFKRHTDVLKIVMQSSLIAACVIYVDEFWQIYLNNISFPLALFGVVSASLAITRAPGALMASNLLKKFSHKTVVSAASFIAAGGILWAAFAKSAWGIIGMAVVWFAVALLDPVSTGYIHRKADSSARATIESAGAMILRLLSIGIGLVFGYVSDRYGIFSSFGMLGIACIVSSAWFVLSIAKIGKNLS